MTESPGTPEQQQKLRTAEDAAQEPHLRTELEELAEDIFGLNFRSFRSFRDLFLSPRTVFAAFTGGDRNRYTPPVRMWLFLISLQVVVSILWGGYGHFVVDGLSGMPRPQLDSLFGTAGLDDAQLRDRLETFGGIYGTVAALAHAPLVGLFSALALFAVPARVRPLSWVGKLNITFCVLTAGSVIGLLLMPVLASDPTANGLGSVGIIVLVYIITFVRGAPGTLTRTRVGATLFGLLIGALIMLLVLIGGTLMTILSFTLALAQLPPLG